jgi:hypothetical protein
MKSSAFDNFSEYSQDALDFARCQRADGTFYGTSGQCRKGTPAGAKEKKAKAEKKAPKAKRQTAMEKYVARRTDVQKRADALQRLESDKRNVKFFKGKPLEEMSIKILAQTKKDLEDTKGVDKAVLAKEQRRRTPEARAKMAKQKDALKKSKAKIDRRLKKDLSPSEKSKLTEQLSRVNDALAKVDSRSKGELVDK